MHFAALLALAIPATIQAQAPAPDTAALRRALSAVPAGTPVRVEIGPRRFIAPVAGSMADGFALRDSAGGSQVVRYADVSRLWVRKRAIGAGMAVGAAAGTGTGVFFGLLASGLCESTDCPSPGQSAVVGGLIVGLIGAASGAIIGAAIPRWDLAWSSPAGGRQGEPRTTTVSVPPPGRDAGVEQRRVGEFTALAVSGFGGFPADSITPDQGVMIGLEGALGFRAGRFAFGPEAGMLFGDQRNWSLAGTARFDLTDTRQGKLTPYLVGGLGGMFWRYTNFQNDLLTATIGAGVTTGARGRFELRWHPAVQNTGLPKPRLVTVAAGYRFVW